jgi:hypothetical protein
MIKGRRKSFEERCRQRGYDLQAAWACVVAEDGDIITVDESHPAYPRSPQAQRFFRPDGGPGTEMKVLLSRIGITSSPTCSCNARARTMDEKGVSWCEENVETICDWLAEESAKRKLPFVRLAGKVIINMAIKRAKKHNSQ